MHARLQETVHLCWGLSYQLNQANDIEDLSRLFCALLEQRGQLKPNTAGAGLGVLDSKNKMPLKLKANGTVISLGALPGALKGPVPWWASMQIKFYIDNTKKLLQHYPHNIHTATSRKMDYAIHMVLVFKPLLGGL